jgi:hypothetical protein
VGRRWFPGGAFTTPPNPIHPYEKLTWPSARDAAQGASPVWSSPLKLLAIALAVPLLIGAPAQAQTAPPPAAAAVARDDISVVLETLNKMLGSYIDAGKVPAARNALKANRDRYLGLTDPQALAKALTTDIGTALGDKHFYVRAPGAASPTASARDPAARAAAEARIAYGVETVRRLPGNVGYLDLRLFGMTPESAARADAAMDLLSDTEALIIDLRRNGGGGGEAMGALFARLSTTPIPRSVQIWRRDDGGFDRVQPETPERPAQKRYGKPVYILTSDRTFSAAETFAYDLQAARRATIVGETTRGGANPMNRPLLQLGSGFLAFISNGRSENPITGGTANGAGVRPDLATGADGALEAAYRAALAALPDEAQGERARAKADPAAALAGA